MLHITLVQWFVLALSAFAVGVSKTGIAGLGIVAVAMFAIAVPAKISVGLILPVLVTGDICAVLLYRRKAVWRHLVHLFPWAIVGVVLGYFTLGWINKGQLAHYIGAVLQALTGNGAKGYLNDLLGHLIGVILLVLTVLQVVRKLNANKQADAADYPDSGVVQSRLTMAVMGVLAGFTTMVANAAGPIMVLYLLATRLPKVEFIGTGAWFYFVLNLIKVPFSAKLGLINPPSLLVDAELAPMVIMGAFAGRAILHKIDQSIFENAAIALTLLAALKLIF